MDPLNHTDFKFHPQITQIGCYWGGVGHTELYLLEGERLASRRHLHGARSRQIHIAGAGEHWSLARRH